MDADTVVSGDLVTEPDNYGWCDATEVVFTASRTVPRPRSDGVAFV
jgi:hypothetical protein